MVATHNYTWQQGEDLILQLIYRQGEPDAGGVVPPPPLDLTGFSVRMDLVTSSGDWRYTFNSEDLSAETDIRPDIEGEQTDTEVEVETLGTNGEIRIAIPRYLTLPGGALYEDITTQGSNTFKYDIFLRNISSVNESIPQGMQRKIIKGDITVEESYTLWT